MIKAIVTGASYGGMEAIKLLVTELSSAGIKVPVIAVLHIGNNNIHTYLSLLNSTTGFVVKEASEKEFIAPGTVYFAPPNYHLQIENNFTFSLSTDRKVNFSRPSIDVLFETAAWSFNENLLGVLLTGSNNDGALGLKTIQNYGGTTIVENPETAQARTMPQSAAELFTPDYILDLRDITAKIVELCR
jgi:two-component system, chemotaxis family, protein-glutamate methylesterase/glutaminase